MDQLLENPQAIFLLVFMAIAFLKMIGKNLKGANPEEEGENPADPYDYEAAREQILEERRTSEPTPSSSGKQPSPTAPEQLSILDFIVPAGPRGPEKATPPPLPSSRPKAPPLPDPEPVWSARPKPRPTLSPAEAEALERVKKEQSQPIPRSRALHRPPIREQIASPTAARDAIILGEILGPPKGQQRFSQLGPLDNR
jgi:hypothetical protein